MAPWKIAFRTIAPYPNISPNPNPNSKGEFVGGNLPRAILRGATFRSRAFMIKKVVQFLFQKKTLKNLDFRHFLILRGKDL